MDLLIEIQIRSDVLRRVFYEYYSSLEKQDQTVFSHTADAECIPYMDNVDQICDFIFWMNGRTPVEVYQKIRENAGRANDMFKYGLRFALWMAIEYEKNKKSSGIVFCR